MAASSHKAHQILTNALRIRLVTIYGNGAGGVRVQHMSPYNTYELDAPSPRIPGLMRPDESDIGVENVSMSWQWEPTEKI